MEEQATERVSEICYTDTKLQQHEEEKKEESASPGPGKDLK